MCEGEIKLEIAGTVNIGPKGQIVIPKNIRDKLKMKPGDNLTLLLKNNKYVGFVKSDDMGGLMKFIKN